MKLISICILLSLSLFANNKNILDKCYKFEKKDFISTLAKQTDLKVDMSILEKKNVIYLSFLSEEYIPYANDAIEFYCMKEKNSSFNCVGGDDSGVMSLDVKNSEVYLNIKHAILAQTPDDPIIHEVKSINSSYSKGTIFNCI